MPGLKKNPTARQAAREAFLSKEEQANIEAKRQQIRFWNFRENPVRFAREGLGFTPKNCQAEILWALRGDHFVRRTGERIENPFNPTGKKRIVWHSGHNCGKTALEVVSALWYSFAHPGSIVVDTAPTYERQVVKIFWTELKRWAAKIDTGEFELTKSRLDWKYPATAGFKQWFITGESATQGENIAGFHEPRGVFFIIDEASGVDDSIFEAIEGALSDVGGNYRILLCGNPTKATGEFYRAYYDPKYEPLYLRFHTSSVESQLVSKEWVEQMKVKWGEDSPAYRSRVLGLPPTDDPTALIPYHLIVEAVDRWRNSKPHAGRAVFGVDVARFGDDDSVVATRRGPRLEELKTVHGYDSIEVADILRQSVRNANDEYELAAIDIIGYGSGVFDQARRHGVRCRAINVGARASEPDEFMNTRAELCWRMRDWFLTGEAQIPDDEDLVAELQQLRVTFESGKTQIESKEAMKRRLGRSPDRADALMLTFGASKATDWGALGRAYSLSDYERGVIAGAGRLPLGAFDAGLVSGGSRL